MSDNKGYIKLYRSCRHNSLWKEKPFSRWQAFEYLLLAAAYEPTDALIKNQIVHIERGQLIRAIRTLANDWGWSTKKVINFLTLLENTKMAISKGRHVYWYSNPVEMNRGYALNGLVVLSWQSKFPAAKINKMSGWYMGKATGETGNIEYLRISKREFEVHKKSDYL